MLVGFVIPLKPKCISSNWAQDNLRLYNTVKSILNQTTQSFKIFIVYTDLPTSVQESEKVQLIPALFEFMSYTQLDLAPDVIAFHKSESMIEKRLDKGKKITYGSKMAKEAGCDYIMSVDADDLIHHTLVNYVSNHHEEKKVAGWYIPNGYVMQAGRNKLLRHHQLHFFNGSTHIVRSDLIPIPNFESTDFHDYSFFTAHGWLIDRIKEMFGETLHKIPFHAVLYLVHDNNISNVKEVVFGKGIKNRIKHLLYRKKITPDIIQAFSI